MLFGYLIFIFRRSITMHNDLLTSKTSRAMNCIKNLNLYWHGNDLKFEQSEN
jgi:hypothetical protein